MNRWKVSSLAAVLALHGVAFAQGYGQFDPAKTPAKYAPDRTIDLLDVKAVLDVDYTGRSFKGKSTNTVVALRSGTKEIMLHAGPSVKISSLKVDGKEASYTRDGKKLFIKVPTMNKGQQAIIVTTYTGGAAGARNMMGDGFHWHTPNAANPNKIGFWTQGETQTNSDWVVTWDYPNDFATTAVTVTVPANWMAICNGLLQSNTLDATKKRRTFAWKMTQPHATYLMSIVAGPMEVKYDKWRDVQLIYTVPVGKADLIDDSFGDTKDMLEFFSTRLGVKYAWPKYAQNATFDFPGGMENVSATTLGEFALTDKREGFRNMASLNSHELGHQWFGDLVTCKHWGDAWLNESFATYKQHMYFEHSRGPNGYAFEVDQAMGEYFAESRRYKRPISTKNYPDQEMMFDSHTYPKGGVVLHTLRRLLGDEAFFSGLNKYLTKNRHTPVESADLRKAMTEASGVNLEPFWEQWIEKPGHPVLDYNWTFEAGKVKLAVDQKQDTSAGTPIYKIAAKVGIISNGKLVRVPVTLNAANQTIELPVGTQPEAVLLDPDHDFLREIPKLNWKREELLAIALYGSNPNDKSEAARRIMRGEPTDAEIKALSGMIAKDTAMFPAIRTIQPFVVLAKPELRSFFMTMARHPNMSLQTEAIRGLGGLPKDDAGVALLRSFINDKDGYGPVTAAIKVLSQWDAKENKAIFEKALKIKSRANRIKLAAEKALEAAKEG